VLEVVHAWNFLDQHGADFDPHYGADKARARAEAIVTEVTADVPGLETVLHVVNDHAAPALEDASEGALMVVVGARGLGGFRGMVLGSVSQHLVHHARCPVLIVR
jgi:nucleotide-binding universal stress UspA family protein